MKNVAVLPADTYTVINKGIITSYDRKIITMLYQPIIGYTAVSLYNALLDDLEKSQIMCEDLTHHHLMNTMQLRLEDILISREKLEAVGLIKTYMKKDNINQYVYLIYSPISANEFFNHPILNVVLYNNLGKKEYEKVKSYFKVPKIVLKDYEDITASFDDVFTPCRGSVEVSDEIISNNSNNININSKIDFNLLISGMPEYEKCFTNDLKELINTLSYIYGLDTLDMQSLIRNSINEKNIIDKNVLRKSCRDYYKFDNFGNLPTLIYTRQPEYLKKPKGDNSKLAKIIYTFENISPYQLLKAKYKGGNPTERDKKLIEDLLVEQKLAPGVVNVLISYILKINNEQLNRSYVETLAGQWKRLNIETVEEAMKFAEKKHKEFNKTIHKTSEKTTSKKVKEEKLPTWFNKDQEIVETTLEEKEEIDKIINELV